MLSRLMSTTSRQLLTATAHCGVFIFFSSNLIVNHSIYTSSEIFITSIGTGIWGLAALHGLYRRAKAFHAARAQQADESTDKPVLCMRESSHSAINNSLHMMAAGLFIATDVVDLVIGPAPGAAPFPRNIYIPRIIGSGLWETSAMLGLFTVFAYDRNLELAPERDVQSLGLHISHYSLLMEGMLDIAVVLFAYSIYANEEIYPLKAVANALWSFNAVVNSDAAIGGAIKHYKTLHEADQQAVEIIESSLQTNVRADAVSLDDSDSLQDAVRRPSV